MFTRNEYRSFIHPGPSLNFGTEMKHYYTFPTMNAELKPGSPTLQMLRNRIFPFLGLVGVIYFFLVSLDMMGVSFQLFGTRLASQLVHTASNPFIGLFIGMLATAIVQSSSTITSTVVVMVAAGAFGPTGDPETIGLALPIIMGANIGTSVTSTIVSLGHITNRQEYRKAISAASVHGFFNIITVVVLFPLEYFFGILSRPAAALADVLHVGGGDGGLLSALKVVKHTVTPASQMFLKGGEALFGANLLPTLLLLLALVMMFVCLRLLTNSLKKRMIGQLQDRVNRVLFGNPVKAIVWGAGITAFVQSSSVTTSLTVPLVASNRVSLRKAFPFLLGANIGTTTTALIAALFTTGTNPGAGLAIALCHLFFNLGGVLVVFPIPQIRMVPVYMARAVGRATMRNRLFGIGYIAVTFFLIPFLLILMTGTRSPRTPKTTSLNQDEVHTQVDWKENSSAYISKAPAK